MSAYSKWERRSEFANALLVRTADPSGLRDALRVALHLAFKAGERAGAKRVKELTAELCKTAVMLRSMSVK